jgi:hypothetical protein
LAATFSAMTPSQPVVLSTAHGKLPPVALAMSPSAEAQFWYDATEALPNKLIAMDQRVGGGMRLRKRIASARLLRAQSGTWLLRRSVFEAVLTDLQATDLVLVPLEAHDAEGLIDDDWMFLHVSTVVTVDRRASTFGPHPEPERKGQQPLLLRWTEAPEPSLFRLAEHPRVLCASRDLFERLHRVSKRVIVEATPPYSRHPAFFGVAF